MKSPSGDSSSLAALAATWNTTAPRGSAGAGQRVVPRAGAVLPPEPPPVCWMCPGWAGGGPFLKSPKARTIRPPRLGNARGNTRQRRPADGVVVAPEPDHVLARVEHHVADGAAAARHVGRREEAVCPGVEADEAVG